MTENKKKGTSTSKNTRQAIEQKIAAALVAYKEQIGEKKFNEKVEKAAKLIVKGMKKAPVAKPAPKKAVAVKVAAPPKVIVPKEAAPKTAKKTIKLPAKKAVATTKKAPVKK